MGGRLPTVRPLSPASAKQEGWESSEASPAYIVTWAMAAVDPKYGPWVDKLPPPWNICCLFLSCLHFTQ